MAKFVATKAGFRDGRRIDAGQTFDAPEGSEASWFDPVDPPKAEPKAPAKKASKKKSSKKED